MKEATPDKLDSQMIRKGLLSIRNSQIELLNELKNETQQLKKTPLRFATSTEDSKSDPPSKMDHIFSFPPENAESIVRYNPPSPSPVDKPFSFGVGTEKHFEAEVTYLKDENKMLNETLQKLLYSRSLDKERVRQLESYLYFSSKLHLQLYNQLLNQAPLSEVRKAFQNDMRLNDDVYAKYQESNFQLILQLLQEKEADQQPFRIGSNPPNAKQMQITAQLGELKDQLVMLLKTNSQKSESVAQFQGQNSRLRQHNQVLTRKCEQLQHRLVKLESDNKELALCWERQINERKGLSGEFQKVKQASGVTGQREKHFALHQKELQMKLNNTIQQLKEKEQTENVQADSIKKLSETVNALREENERLKREIKSIEEIRAQMKREDMSASKMRQNQMVGQLTQQGHLLQRYEREIYELKMHLGQTKRNLDLMAQMNAKSRQNDMHRMHAIRTNSTVEHLWQVKRVEFDNINELLQEIRDRSKRL